MNNRNNDSPQRIFLRFDFGLRRQSRAMSDEVVELAFGSVRIANFLLFSVSESLRLVVPLRGIASLCFAISPSPLFKANHKKANSQTCEWYNNSQVCGKSFLHK